MDQKSQDFFNRTPVIGVDFDGTIVEHRWPKIGPGVPGAIFWLRRFVDAGARLILWTNRSNGSLAEATNYLKTWGVDLWAINENPEQHHWTTSPKAYFHVLIDDVCYGVPLVRPLVGQPYVDWVKLGPDVFGQIQLWKPRAIL